MTSRAIRQQAATAVCAPCGIGVHANCSGEAYVTDNPHVPTRHTTAAAWVACTCIKGEHPNRRRHR